MRRAAALVALALAAPPAVTFAAPNPAAADVFGPIGLASESTAPVPQADRDQAEYAHDPAISANGEFVAFDGSIGGVTGVWRRDLKTGEVQPVAVGAPAGVKCALEPSTAEPHKLSEQKSPCDAELPSISADGQHVSFTTTAALDPVDDTNTGPDVYVRNMEVPVYGCGAAAPVYGCDPAIPPSSSPAPAGAFTLASAVDGSAQGLTYEFAIKPHPTKQEEEELKTRQERYGSEASGRSALSANGLQVAFVTTAVSNLDGPQTPALQVAVRDIQTETTQLVSVAYDPATGRPAVSATGGPEPVSAPEGASTYGAVYAPNGTPPAFRAPSAYTLTQTIGASLSADGSTVAWMGQDIAEQAPTLPEDDLPAHYSEPLWRRVAEGPATPTRRVTGGSDPTAPACISSGETALLEPFTPTDPCEGPFRSEPHSSGTSGIWAGGIGDSVPQLSADGQTVAFLAQAPTFSQGSDFGQDVENTPSDLFVADMAPGLDRVQALTRLTEVASANLTDFSTTAPIVDLGISPDGGQVAFTTERTAFPLGSPAFISTRASVPGMVELFDADLANETLTRVTQGYEGEPAEHPHPPEIAGQDPYNRISSTDGALSPSFSGDGDLLAFSSTASNLVYGDGNTPPIDSTKVDGSDAFVVERLIFKGSPAQQYVSPPPPNPLLEPAWLLGVTAVSRPDGSVLLDVDAPAAGGLRAAAQADVVLDLGSRPPAAGRARDHSSHRARGSHERRRAAAAPSRSGDAARSHARAPRARVAARTVAAATAAATAGGPAQLTLTLDPRYRALASYSGGLSGTVTVIFTAPGQPVLRQSIAVTFITTARRAGRSPRADHRRGHRKPARTGSRG
jgi:WD40-like Beta Propeller Repeat